MICLRRVRWLIVTWLLCVSGGAGTCLHAQELAITFDDLPAHGPLPPGMARPAVVKSLLGSFAAEKLPPVYGFINGFRVASYPYQIHILQAWAASVSLGPHRKVVI